MSAVCDGVTDETCCISNPSLSCDNYMSLYCSDPSNLNNPVCSCINSKLPCAPFTDPSCSNKNTYKPFVTTNLCSKQPLCINNFYDDGTAGNIIQVCGSTGLESFVLYRYPIITIILVFIFILSSIYVYNFIKKYGRSI